MELILYRLANLYEDLVSESKSMDTIFHNAQEATKDILLLADKVEQMVQEFSDTMFMQTYLQFISCTGFSSVRFKEIIDNLREKKGDTTVYTGYYLCGAKAPLSKKSLVLIAKFTKEIMGQIVYSSHHAEDVLKMKPAQLIGAPITAVMPNCYKACHDMFVEKFFDNIDRKYKQFDVPVYTIDPEGYMSILNAIFKVYPYFTLDLRLVS